MGILDEAIREHLELKRQHGAGDSELKQLEDEAFGQAERPGGEEAPPEPAEEEQPAAEHETVVEQPTEHFDVEEELATSAKPGPSDEELVEEEMGEPRLAPVDPLADVEQAGEPEVEAEPLHDDTEIEAAEEDEDDDFWNEQRLSEELDQALDAPLVEAGSETAEHDAIDGAEEVEEAEEEDPPTSPPKDSDVLENTPDFLEDTPEDDELWFEQKPPKDFDFDD